MTVSLSMKSNNCAELSKKDLGNNATLAGWVDTVRDLGGITFVELRDRSGSFQLVADPKVNPEIHKIFQTLKSLRMQVSALYIRSLT